MEFKLLTFEEKLTELLEEANEAYNKIDAERDKLEEQKENKEEALYWINELRCTLDTLRRLGFAK